MDTFLEIWPVYGHLNQLCTCLSGHTRKMPHQKCVCDKQQVIALTYGISKHKSMIQMNLFTEKKQTDRENKLIITKGETGREKLEIGDQQIHTTIYKVDKQKGPTV